MEVNPDRVMRYGGLGWFEPRLPSLDPYKRTQDKPWALRQNSSFFSGRSTSQAVKPFTHRDKGEVVLLFPNLFKLLLEEVLGK